ncbi:hypothetical protein [Gimesia algae]|uniref:Uncharacterized protein n=1 Tax=Gimesia algae TaxID=2527971 RepID=A0A517VHL6_9PLAN|nr:hypothetical protein [Gimesia algae]QDT92513.1 hypothetical protein Pan161_41810 [Gimesia algae]
MQKIKMLIITVMLSLFFAEPAITQTVVYPKRHWYYSYYHYRTYSNPVIILENNTYALSDLIRARGDSAVDIAYARKLHAQAARMEIENWVLRLKAYYEAKAIREAERLKRAYNHLDSKRLQNNRKWERLKNHPELNGPAIANGNALNFLLYRLSNSVLAYEYSQKSHSIDGIELKKMTLSPEVLHGVMLQQRLTNGRRMVFRADEGKPLDTNWWPNVLRDDYFNDGREEFEKQRDLVIQEASAGGISSKSLNALYVAFENMRDRFNSKNTRDSRFKEGMESWQQYYRAEIFLKSLWTEISLLQSTADIGILGAGLKFDPKEGECNVITLLQFISRNGLDFAPAKPGDEPAYHQLFNLMRDLYVNIADEDESLQPETKKYQQMLKRDGVPDVSSGSVLNK